MFTSSFRPLMAFIGPRGQISLNICVPQLQWGASSANLKLVPCEGSRQTVQGQTALPMTTTPSGRSRAIYLLPCSFSSFSCFDYDDDDDDFWYL